MYFPLEHQEFLEHQCGQMCLDMRNFSFSQMKRISPYNITSYSRPIVLWIARLLPKPRAWVRVPGKAWVFPCGMSNLWRHDSAHRAPLTRGSYFRRSPGLWQTTATVSPLEKKIFSLIVFTKYDLGLLHFFIILAGSHMLFTLKRTFSPTLKCEIFLSCLS